MKVAIFKPGTHTSAQGRTKTYTVEDCERMVELYNEQPADDRHEAPAVLGHPKDNGPAYGWVEKLEFTGGKLYAHVKECATEFAEWLEAGFYKKVSPSFYADGKLRHVGFLGAQPPAIKGLPAFEFASGDDGETYEFGEATEFADYRVTTLGGLFRRLREWFIAEKGAETAEQVVPNKELDTLGSEPYDETSWMRQELAELRGIVNTLNDTPTRTSYSEKEPMNGNAKDGASGAADDGQQRANVPDDYAELTAKVDEQGRTITSQQKLIEDQSKVIATLQARNQEADFREFLDGADMKGRITPGNRAVAIGMLKRAAELEGEFEYSEGDETKQGTALEVVKAELRTWPNAVDFSEVASKSRATGSTSVAKTGFDIPERSDFDEGRRELTMRAKKLAAEKNIEFTEALDLVIAEDN